VDGNRSAPGNAPTKTTQCPQRQTPLGSLFSEASFQCGLSVENTSILLNFDLPAATPAERGSVEINALPRGGPNGPLPSLLGSLSHISENTKTYNPAYATCLDNCPDNLVAKISETDQVPEDMKKNDATTAFPFSLSTIRRGRNRRTQENLHCNALKDREVDKYRDTLRRGWKF